MAKKKKATKKKAAKKAAPKKIAPVEKSTTTDVREEVASQSSKSSVKTSL